MSIELDHVFVCASPGAPEAEEFIRFGLHEGLPNEHPGQGTSCRRFGFANTMIELLWVSNPRDSQSEATGRTLLWDRWSARDGRASPFGVCVRPANPESTELPFPAWEYTRQGKFPLPCESAASQYRAGRQQWRPATRPSGY
jgi:hypothetical protein